MTGPVRSVTTPLSPLGPARTGPLVAPPFEAPPLPLAAGAAPPEPLPGDRSEVASLAAELPPAGALDGLDFDDLDDEEVAGPAPEGEAPALLDGAASLAGEANRLVGELATAPVVVSSRAGGAVEDLSGRMGTASEVLGAAQTVVVLGDAVMSGDLGEVAGAVTELAVGEIRQDLATVRAGVADLAEGEILQGTAELVAGSAGLADDVADAATFVGAVSTASVVARGAPVLGLVAGAAEVGVALAADPPDYEAAAVGSIETVGSAMMMVPGPTQVVGAALVAGAMIYENWDSITSGAGAAVDWLASWW